MSQAMAMRLLPFRSERWCKDHNRAEWPPGQVACWVSTSTVNASDGKIVSLRDAPKVSAGIGPSRGLAKLTVRRFLARDGDVSGSTLGSAAIMGKYLGASLIELVTVADEEEAQEAAA